MQPLFAPSSVQLLDDERSVLFILANGSRHVARLIPSARARNLRLRLSPDRGLLLTVPSAMPATALPALLFSFLPWLERHLPACPAPAPLVVPQSIFLPLRGTALRVISAGPLAEGRRQTPSCTEPPLLLRSGSKRLLALVRHEELRLYAVAAPEDAALLLRHCCRPTCNSSPDGEASPSPGSPSGTSAVAGAAAAPVTAAASASTGVPSCCPFPFWTTCAGTSCATCVIWIIPRPTGRHWPRSPLTGNSRNAA